MVTVVTMVNVVTMATVVTIVTVVTMATVVTIVTVVEVRGWWCPHVPYNGLGYNIQSLFVHVFKPNVCNFVYQL